MRVRAHLTELQGEDTNKLTFCHRSLQLVVALHVDDIGIAECSGLRQEVALQ